MKLSIVKVLFGLGLIASAFFLVRSQSTEDVRESAAWSLVKVIDGDTIEVKDSSNIAQRVRLVGIDTAERGECGFSEASSALAQLVGFSTFDLVLADTDDKDRYGRLLRYVDVEGRDLGLELIKDGYAVAAYDSRTNYPKHTREDSYISADESSPNYC